MIAARKRGGAQEFRDSDHVILGMAFYIIRQKTRLGDVWVLE